jgi:murein L,D-transpeptidase YafK
MASSRKRRWPAVLFTLVALLAVAGGIVYAFWPQIFAFVEDELIRADKVRHWRMAQAGETLPGTPDLKNLETRLSEKGLKLGDPIFVRIFKRDFELELWMKRGDSFVKFATYPICMWSGGLGPKYREGDHQSPEGFYTVETTQLNPNSKYHRSFNLGYPNAYDRAHGRTGSFLMVHGHCLSIGCYAMTDPVIDEIWAIVTAALNGGQQRFQVQAFPFRMTDTNLSLHSGNNHIDFWRQLKVGHDLFARDHVPPRISVCDGRYVFQQGNQGTDGSQPIEATCPAT